MTIDYMEAMDDAELGRIVKDAARRSAEEDVTPYAVCYRAALLLVCNSFSVNATRTKLQLSGVTYKGEAKGDWEVVARKVGPK